MTAKQKTKDAPKKSKNGSWRVLIDVIRARPLIPDKEIYRTYGFTKTVVQRAKQELLRQGFDAQAIGYAIVSEYFDRYPDAPHKQAAQALGTTVSNINYLRQFYCAKTEEQRERDEEAAIEYATRPAWYVAEYTQRGCMGVNLREDEFKRYIVLYEHKRQGKHSPIVDHNPYRPKNKG